MKLECYWFLQLQCFVSDNNESSLVINDVVCFIDDYGSTFLLYYLIVFEFCPTFTCQGIGSDFARAYLSNVCVAKELHRNGLGYALVSKAKSVAAEWGTVYVTDG